jgi:hypothetical protein
MYCLLVSLKAENSTPAGCTHHTCTQHKACIDTQCLFKAYALHQIIDLSQAAAQSLFLLLCILTECDAGVGLLQRMLFFHLGPLAGVFQRFHVCTGFVQLG